MAETEKRELPLALSDDLKMVLPWGNKGSGGSHSHLVHVLYCGLNVGAPPPMNMLNPAMF
jgi:hypothetical protein